MTTLAVETAVSLKNILVATDFSGASEAALKVAANLARRYGGKLTIAFVVVPEIYPSSVPEAVVTVTDEVRRRAEYELGRLRQSEVLSGIQHEEVLREGGVRDELLAIARRHGTDLIVIGTHGRGGIEKLLLGSVAETVFRAASCPVLTVGPHLAQRALVDVVFHRILLPIDLSPISLEAAPYAFSIAKQHGGEVTVLHVVDRISDQSHRSRMIVRRTYLEQMRKLLPAPEELGNAVKYEVCFGGAAPEILEEATRMQAQLIVLGVRKSELMASHLPWATASHLVREARCPVLTVRG